MRAFVATVGLVALAFAFGPTPIANAARSKLSVGESVVDLAASRDGRWLAAAPSGEPPVLFHVAEIPAADAEGTAVESPPGRRPLACPPASIGSLAFTPDSRFLVVKPQLEDAEMKVLVFSSQTSADGVTWWYGDETGAIAAKN